LSWHLKDYNEPIRLNLNDLEKKAIVAFLKTLTDEQFLKDPKYSDPFK
jgi:cytochrome c peroxidase